jgi:hypothetical protein
MTLLTHSNKIDSDRQPKLYYKSKGLSDTERPDHSKDDRHRLDPIPLVAEEGNVIEITKQ